MKSLDRKDVAALIVAALFLFGCISSSQRAAKTLQPGQGSGVVSVGLVTNSEADEPIYLNDLGVHVGVARGVELGVAHTYDLTADNDAMFSTFWFDSKFQLTNLANDLNKFNVCVGLSKGNVYNVEDETVNITSLPISFGSDLSERTSLFAIYRPEFFSEGFFPDGDSFEGPRHSFTLGLELAMKQPTNTSWTPRLGLTIGLMNSLAGGGALENVVFGIGLHFDSPFSGKSD